MNDLTSILPKELLNYWDDENKSNESVDVQEKLRTAYALNMCTVSISQIIDNRDQYIMDQEYNAILNNLNLQNMPNDPSLLKILKEILNVITFFRIQDGEKAFIEEDYRQALKQNLTKSINIAGALGTVGSLGIHNLTNPGSLIKAGISVASTVGIGYMNYRSGKTQALLQKKKKEWELQRAAIEQLNGLRRELLDTAWHLTKNFDIYDDFRLTETQIAQYLNILKDQDDFKRFERLEFIKEKFFAYPPFWYQLGHAAKLVALKEPQQKDYYNRYAKACFEFFVYQIKTNLLRDDQIASSCALEYSELLNEKTEKEKIADLLEIAQKYSGNKNDVLQMCAIGYLRIGNVKKASRILWRLVNEKYDESFNAELLSVIYYQLYMNILDEKTETDVDFLFDESVLGVIDNNATHRKGVEEKKNAVEHAYNLLCSRVTEKDYIIPLPNDGSRTTAAGYLKLRKDLLNIKMSEIATQICERFLRRFVEIILPNELFQDEIFVGLDSNINEIIRDRLDDISRRQMTSRYQAVLNQEPITIKVYYVLNDLYKCLGVFSNYSKTLEEDLELQVGSYLSQKVQEYKQIEKEMESQSFQMNNISKKSELFDIRDVLETVNNSLRLYIQDLLNGFTDISEVSDQERDLYLFARQFEFEIPVIPCARLYFDNVRYDSGKKHVPFELDATVLGIEDIAKYEQEKQAERERFEAIVDVINQNKEGLILDSEKSEMRVYGEDTFVQFVNGISELEGQVPVAIIMNCKNGWFNSNKKTLAFTTSGLYWIEKGISAPFNNITFGDKNKMLIGGKAFKNENLDATTLRKIVEDLIPIVDKSKNFDARRFMNEEKIEDKARKIVNRYTAMAVANGANPIPMAGVCPHVSIQVSMLYSIANVYKLNLTQTQLKELVIKVLEETGRSAGEQQIFKTISSIIPGGALASSVISASSAGALTHSVGYSFIEYCKSMVKSDGVNKPEDFIKQGVEEMSPKIAKMVVEKEEVIENEMKQSIAIESVNIELERLEKAKSDALIEIKSRHKDAALVMRDSLEIIKNNGEDNFCQIDHSEEFSVLDSKLDDLLGGNE